MVQIIFINGTSSAGKSTISTALRVLFPTFCYFASDQLAESRFRPLIRTDQERARFFDGFHRSIGAFAGAGCDMIVEHIIEELNWSTDLELILRSHRVFWVGIHCPIEVLKQREIDRGNRSVGEAEYHLKTHEYVKLYNVEVHSNVQSTEECVQTIMAAYNLWES